MRSAWPRTNLGTAGHGQSSLAREGCLPALYAVHETLGISGVFSWHLEHSALLKLSDQNILRETNRVRIANGR